ncbi:MAG: TlpA family protein disulfide reductase [Arcobacter sp.]|nr:MAG: TlpA family protein disulfide reductase [Arcobacter sp.]
MQFKKIAFFIISTTLIFTGCGSKEEKKTEIVKEIVKKEQTKFNLTSTDLQTITLEKTDKGMIFKGLEGKIVLLNFFATWCPPCRAEIPHLNNLKEKYKEKFEVVALDMGGKDGNLTTKEKLNDFINEYKINYIVTNSEENFKVAEVMGGVKIIPTLFLINQTGTIVQKYVGIVPEEMMESDIKKALGK